MKISVIIPVYNVYDYLDKCLSSLTNQTDTNFEVIIVNDGSTDDSQKIIDKYVSENANMHSYIKENGGLSSARNYGLKKATGDYILFLDSDDYYELNTIETLKKEAQNGDDIITFQMYIDENNKITKQKMEMEEFIFDKNIPASKRLLLYNPSACDKMFKKELLEKNNFEFIEGVYYEDLGSIPLLAMYTNKIKFTKHYLYHYLKRENSTMNKIKYNSKIEDIFLVTDRVSAIFKKENLYNEYKEEIEYIYIHHLLRAASIRFLDYNKYDMVDKIRKIIKENFPKFKENKYFKKYGFKRKLMCKLIYKEHYTIIKILRKI